MKKCINESARFNYHSIHSQLIRTFSVIQLQSNRIESINESINHLVNESVNEAINHQSTHPT